ncbi:F0F1 ATP synthase subunit A [Escherichia coli]|nr:F0F1 ATP synthase subunit A [Escherichia coli]
MFTHLLPIGTPPVLSPFIVCVETIRNLIRPLTLSVRLAANIIAGHLIITLISISFDPTALISTYSIIALLPLFILELAVALIQAFVFTILLTLYSTEIH